MNTSLLCTIQKYQRRVLPRKWRLFATACVRRAMVIGPNTRMVADLAHLIETAEQWADTLISAKDAEKVFHGSRSAAKFLLLRDPYLAVRNIVNAGSLLFTKSVQPEIWLREQDIQCELFNCIIGNANKLTIDTRTLTWNDSTVIRLAKTAYFEYRWDALLVLADALEEAGLPATITIKGQCEWRWLGKEWILTNVINPGGNYPMHRGKCMMDMTITEGTLEIPNPVLTHLRNPGSHARGCWPVDLILGKDKA